MNKSMWFAGVGPILYLLWLVVVGPVTTPELQVVQHSDDVLVAPNHGATLLQKLVGPMLEQIPEEQEQGDGDGEENRPTHCDNWYTTPKAQKCQCSRAVHSDCDTPIPDVAMDKKCSTYCKKQNCKCVSKCTS